MNTAQRVQAAMLAISLSAAGCRSNTEARGSAHSVRFWDKVETPGTFSHYNFSTIEEVLPTGNPKKVGKLSGSQLVIRGTFDGLLPGTAWNRDLADDPSLSTGTDADPPIVPFDSPTVGARSVRLRVSSFEVLSGTAPTRTPIYIEIPYNGKEPLAEIQRGFQNTPQQFVAILQPSAGPPAFGPPPDEPSPDVRFVPSGQLLFVGDDSHDVALPMIETVSFAKKLIGGAKRLSDIAKRLK